MISSSLALLAVATPWDHPTTTATKTITVTAPAPMAITISQCNTGNAQCCQSTEDTNCAAGSALLGLLDVVLEDLNVLTALRLLSLESTPEASAKPNLFAATTTLSVSHLHWLRRRYA
ncbi:predicted protein [Sparassis crispa]|uniref:Uncharacterized protein n=1 Tax=Sparassis crispa TaxID=139825 RepID=A0A401GTZ5_9APHY|nr:predicted protein [Sparassis crispa]GBE85687.1 predicted protein [Sparassis crispa]